MVDKKNVVIIALLVLLSVTGVGWFAAELKPLEKIPYDSTYRWTEYFRGYEAYLDRRIFYAVMEGTSMAPTIKDNDTVLWVKIDNMAELKVGDIIVYKHPTMPGIDNVCHRIIEVGWNGGYRFRTQGDNMLNPDPYWVPEGNIHGLVIGAIYHS